MAATTTGTTDSGPFSLIPEWVLYSPISDRALRLYGALAAHADRASGQAWPSRRRLADLLGCSLDSIDRAKQELIDLGALAQRPRVEGGGQRSNLYQIIRAQPHSSGPGAAQQRPGGREGAAGGSRTGAAQNKSQSESESRNEAGSLPLALPAPKADDLSPRAKAKLEADVVTRAWWEATTPRPTPAGGFPAVRKIVATLLLAGWRGEEIQAALPRCDGWVSQGALEKQLRLMRSRSGGAANPGDLS